MGVGRGQRSFISPLHSLCHFLHPFPLHPPQFSLFRPSSSDSIKVFRRSTSRFRSPLGVKFPRQSKRISDFRRWILALLTPERFLHFLEDVLDVLGGVEGIRFRVEEGLEQFVGEEGPPTRVIIVDEAAPLLVG